MSKLLWHSNSPWVPTGYGNQTGLFVPYLKEHFELAVSSFYGLDGSRIMWDGVPILPGLGGHFGGEHLARHAESFFGGDAHDGLVVTLMDVWVLDPTITTEVNVAAWCPVDHEPVPDAVRTFFTFGAVPIAMSRFGQQQLLELDPLYVPHAVDTNVFKPEDRRAVRKAVGLSEDAFMVGMVAANKGRPSRKGFSQALAAFKHFHDRHSDAVLYLHTSVEPGLAEGEDIRALMKGLRIPESAVMIPDQYRMIFDPLSSASMSKIYSNMDVLLNPAWGEGFGIPVLEAQACGVPAIVTNFSAMPEVCGAGWHVACRPWWTGLKSWQAIPDVEDIVESLNQCYSISNSDRKLLSEKARRHALKYDVRRVYVDHMLPALKEAERRFADREPISLRQRVAA